MLTIRKLEKSYKNKYSNKIKVFSNLNLKVDKGEFVAIFGPNGCGKSTLLNIISGLLEPDAGIVHFDQKSSESVKIGYVFQDYRNSLFPWLSVEENISFPLKIKGLSKRKRLLRVKRLKTRFGFNFKLKSYPYQLSGGQQQYVSIMRSLIIEPDLFLLDEPFSSLDYQSTLSMLKKLEEIWLKTKVTTLFVSHEIEEALFLAEKIILLGDRPTKILRICKNPLLYPRKFEMLTSPECGELKNEILKLYTKDTNHYVN